MTGNQARALREAIEAGAEGAYIGIGSFIGRESSALVEMGAAMIRSEHQISDTPVSVRDPRPCEWDDRFLVATDEGRKLYEEASKRRR